ncbi:prefoldin subunit beta [Candidatus Pacearchaeota archaeon]|nr:prefoldin subunit beta [Candidatus Pacearchaeota archaeon]|tara:strand:- start:204 stop:536 length:333 start_codon:yes stop_codon:yes gene_type:complete
MAEEDNTQAIQELQMLEQNIQPLLAQKQAIQVELNEVLNALEELKTAKDDVYKIISGAMIKSSPDNLKKELEEKKKLLDLRVSSIEKQQTLIESKAEELRKSLVPKQGKK